MPYQNRSRSVRFEFRCTPEEAKIINEKAAAAGMNRTEFLIKSLSEKEITVIEDLQPLLFELRREGVNLNQCLRVANYDENKFPELNEAIKNCNELYLKLLEIYKKISRIK